MLSSSSFFTSSISSSSSFSAFATRVALSFSSSSSFTAFLLSNRNSYTHQTHKHTRPTNSLNLIIRRGFLEQAGGDWEETWKRSVTPWDTEVAAPPLVDLLHPPSSLLNPPKPGTSRALVPGTGSGYECVELAKAGWNVLGIDLAPTAIARAQQVLQEKGKEDERKNKGAWKGKVEYRVADFYEVEGEFDLIFDYTFLCALPPSLRPRWAKKMKELLVPETGQLVTLIFPVQDNAKDKDQLDLKNGPPFEVNCALYKHLLEEKEGFTCIELRGPLTDSIKPRLGREWLGRWKI